MLLKLMIILILSSIQAFSQIDSVKLIIPTGQYAIGTMVYEWTDKTREIQYSSNVGDKRTIIVQMWYPATIDSMDKIAPYSALSKDYQNVQSNSYLRPSFNKELKKAPLILFCPGRGTERYLYSTLIEDLASHGFIVVSIDMPEIGYTIYSDGLIIKPSSEFQPPRGMMGGPYEKVDEFFEKPTKIGNQDLDFAFSKLRELNNLDVNNRFTNKIDFENMGIFGHSLGGRIGGEFASKNKNVKAFISMEGIPPRDVRYGGKINIPSVMLCSSGTWPYAKENYFSLIDNRSNSVYMIELLGFGHNSVTDNPYIYPDSFNYEIDPQIGLIKSRDIITNYFQSVFNKSISLNKVLEGLEQIKFTEYN